MGLKLGLSHCGTVRLLREMEEVTGDWRRLHNEELNVCAYHHVLSR